LAQTILVPYAAFPTIVKMAVRMGVKVYGEEGERRMREQVIDPM
jgi:hypothetical protein